MKKRLQANLRGDEDPKNEITSPRPTSSLATESYSASDLLPLPPPPADLSSSFTNQDHNLSSSLMDPSLDPLVQDLVRGTSPSLSNVTYQIPLPPPKTIAALENLSLGLPAAPAPTHQQASSARTIPVKTQASNSNPVPYNARQSSFETAVDDQLAGLCSSLKLDPNNNSSPYSYPYNVSPKLSASYICGAVPCTNVPHHLSSIC